MKWAAGKRDDSQTAKPRLTEPAGLLAPLAQHLSFFSVFFPFHSPAPWPYARALPCLALIDPTTRHTNSQSSGHTTLPVLGRPSLEQVRELTNALASC